MKNLSVVILSSGMGTRMKSLKPKAIHEVCGKAMISWVYDAARKADPNNIVVVTGEEGDYTSFLDSSAIIAKQKEMKGPVDAAKQALPFILNKDTVILCADMPLVTADIILDSVKKAQDEELCMLSLTDDKGNYSGMYVFKTDALADAIDKISSPDTSEIGFDAIFDALHALGKKTGTMELEKEYLIDVNDRVALYEADKLLRKRINYKHMYNGVTIVDPERTYISPDVVIGQDTTILPGTILEKGTVIGRECVIGPDSKLTKASIGDKTEVVKSVCIEASVGENTHVGPFAYLRPNTKVGNNCRIGDFVELKNSNIDDGTKVSHLTYVGDSDVGKRVNFGCGTVTVNYDGSKKYRTTIGDDVFVGCNTNLVAPVTLKDGAYTAAGSTITDDVPEGALAIARSRQVVKENWNDRRCNK